MASAVAMSRPVSSSKRLDSCADNNKRNHLNLNTTEYYSRSVLNAYLANSWKIVVEEGGFGDAEIGFLALAGGLVQHFGPLQLKSFQGTFQRCYCLE